MPPGKRPRELIERNSDISEWGEKDVRGAYDGPLNIAGEQVDLDDTPGLSDNDTPPGKASK
jgi:hypothetical protein